MTSACEVPEDAKATNSSAQAGVHGGETAAEIADGTPDAEVSLCASLEACSDARLLAILPVLLSTLPGDSKERCLLSLRGALVDEIEGGALGGDSSSFAAWRRALVPQEEQAAPASTEAPQAPPAVKGKRPFHAMAAPFVQAPAPKRRGVEQGSIEATTSVYVANVPYTATEVVISDFFAERCSPGVVTSVRLLRNADGKPKGAAVVELDSSEMASRAMMLNGQFGLEGRKLIVKEDGGPPGKSAGKGMVATDATKHESKVKSKRAGAIGASEKDCRSAIVKNLDFRASAADLGELFAGCGGVAATRIAKDARTGRSRGFAVVEFVDASFLPEVLRRSGRQVRGRPVRVELVGDHKLSDADIPSSEAVTETGAADSASRDAQSGVGSEAGGNVHGALKPEEEAAPAKVAETRAADSTPRDSAGVLGDGEIASQSCVGSEEAGGTVHDALQSHAQMLLARAQAPPEEEAAAARRGRGEAGPRPDVEYPIGEPGLQAALALVSAHATAGALLAAVGPEELKGRLAALGLKSGGVPLERATRLMQLAGVSCTEDVPKELLAKPRKSPPSEALAPVKFVKAGEGDL